MHIRILSCTHPIDMNDAIEPILSVEPADPIERNDPADPIHKADPMLRKDTKEKMESKLSDDMMLKYEKEDLHIDDCGRDFSLATSKDCSTQGGVGSLWKPKLVARIFFSDFFFLHHTKINGKKMWSNLSF